LKKIISLLLGSIVALAFSASVAFSAANEVRAAYFPEWATPNQEAKVKKVYDDALGVPVKWVLFGTGVEMSEAMLSGSIDISFSQGMAPFVNAVNSKNPIKIVDVAVTYGIGNTQCIVGNASGITKDNAIDLEGKKVAVPLGTMADYVFRMSVRALGVDDNKIDVVDQQPPDGSTNLVDGNVAMACLFGKNSIKQALTAGSSLVTPDEAKAAGITMFDIVSVTNKFAKENPEMLRTFVEVTHEYNDKYKAGKSDMAVIAKDATTSLADTTDQMDKFGFPNPAEITKDWCGENGKIVTSLKLMGNLFGSDENPALKDYSKVVDCSFLPQ
jgi:taurine transport system substrate-binding protein